MDSFLEGPHCEELDNDVHILNDEELMELYELGCKIDDDPEDDYNF